jgi:hypothetical protein
MKVFGMAVCSWFGVVHTKFVSRFLKCGIIASIEPETLPLNEKHREEYEAETEQEKRDVVQ